MKGKKIQNWIYITDKNGNIKPMPKGKKATPVWKKLLRDAEKARRIKFQKSIPKSFW